MTAFDPSSCFSRDCDTSDSEADDGNTVADLLDDSGIGDPTVADDDTVSTVTKQGKSPDDIIRVDYAVDPTGLSTSNSITVHFGMTMNYAVMKLVPYDAASGVLGTNKLTYALSGGSPAVFTFTQAFIDDLFDQGGGSFAVRIAEDTAAIAGDVVIAEIDADLTAAAPVDNIDVKHASDPVMEVF